MTDITLSVRDLETRFITRAGTLVPVNKISFDIRRGEIMGLVGESGSGKTVTGFSIMGLVDPPAASPAAKSCFRGAT